MFGAVSCPLRNTAEESTARTLQAARGNTCACWDTRDQMVLTRNFHAVRLMTSAKSTHRLKCFSVLSSTQPEGSPLDLR